MNLDLHKCYDMGALEVSRSWWKKKDSSKLGESLKVSHALLERVLLLFGCDALLDVGNDPINHVFLFIGSQHVCCLELVIQPPLNLCVCVLEPGPIFCFQLESNVLLLCCDEVFVLKNDVLLGAEEGAEAQGEN